MESVKSRQGLYAYRVVIDNTNNTSDVIDRNELSVKISIARITSKQTSIKFLKWLLLLLKMKQMQEATIPPVQ